VDRLSLDYELVASSLGASPDPAALGTALLAALADRYETGHPAGCALHELQQSGATYLFDLAGAAGARDMRRRSAAAPRAGDSPSAQDHRRPSPARARLRGTREA
jgi:hypothetical protein